MAEVKEGEEKQCHKESEWLRQSAITRLLRRRKDERKRGRLRREKMAARTTGDSAYGTMKRRLRQPCIPPVVKSVLEVQTKPSRRDEMEPKRGKQEAPKGQMAMQAHKNASLAAPRRAETRRKHWSLAVLGSPIWRCWPKMGCFTNSLSPGPPTATRHFSYTMYVFVKQSRQLQRSPAAVIHMVRQLLFQAEVKRPGAGLSLSLPLRVLPPDTANYQPMRDG